MFNCPVKGCQERLINYKKLKFHCRKIHNKMFQEVTNTHWCSGCQVFKDLSNFWRSRTVACGWQSECKECRKSIRYNWYKGYNHGRFIGARDKAKRKNKIWTLTEDQYFSIISKPCEYCGFELRNSGIGLDRMDSKYGYTLENVCSSCLECNQAKSDYFTYNEMKRIGEIIRQIKQDRLETKLKKLIESPIQK